MQRVRRPSVARRFGPREKDVVNHRRMQAPNTQHIHLYDTRRASGRGRLMGRFAPWVVGLLAPARTTAVRAEGLILLGSADGRIVGIGEEDAVVRVERTLDAPLAGPLLHTGRTVIATTSTGRIHGLGSDDLRPRWSTRVGLGGLVVAVVAGTRVLVGAEYGRLHALAAETGTQDWSVELAGARITDVVAVDELVVVGTEGGEVIALEASSGRERWREVLGKRVGALAVAGDVVVASTVDAIFGLERRSGRERWRATEGRRAVRLAEGAGAVYSASAQGELAAWLGPGGERLWQTPVGGQIRSVTVTPEVLVLVVMRLDPDGKEVASFVAVDRVSGLVAWELPTTTNAYVAAAYEERVLVAEGSALRALVASTGHPVWIGDGEASISVRAPRRVMKPSVWRRWFISSASVGALLCVLLGVMLLKVLLVDLLELELLEVLARTTADPGANALTALVAAALFGASAAFTALQTRRILSEHRMLRDGIAVVADIVEDEGRPSPLVHYRYHDHRNQLRLGADLADAVTRPPWARPGTKICVLVDPASPDRSIVPSLHEVGFGEVGAVGEVLPDRIGEPLEGVSGHWVLSVDPPVERRWWQRGRRGVSEVAGALDIDESRLCWTAADGQVVEVDAAKALSVQVSVWPVSFVEAEVAISIRAVGALPTTPSVKVRAILPQSALHSGLPVKQERCPWLAPRELIQLWGWLAYHARVGGQELPTIAPTGRRVEEGVVVSEEVATRGR